jgi:hypothetical protein
MKTAMRLFRRGAKRHKSSWDEAPRWALDQAALSLFIIHKLEKIMVDTTAILAEVARERTELAGWKTLSAGKDKVIADTSAALKVATDALAAAGADTAALAKVQADLDTAASNLKNDNDEAAAAIAANVVPAPAPVPTPPTV